MLSTAVWASVSSLRTFMREQQHETLLSHSRWMPMALATPDLRSLGQSRQCRELGRISKRCGVNMESVQSLLVVGGVYYYCFNYQRDNINETPPVQSFQFSVS